MDNEFKFYKLINRVGYYGKINLKITVTESAGLNVNFDEFVEKEWYDSVEFGIKYFYEHHYKKFNQGLNIFVKDLHTMIGDTSSIVVWYVTVKCLCEAFEYSEDLVAFNEEKGVFLVKK